MVELLPWLDVTTIPAGSWRELLGRERLGAATVLAGGVGLYATNEFLTISLLPSTVADIGGQRFYAWVVTVYLVGSVVAATAVNPMLMRFGPRASYLLTLTLFGVGQRGVRGLPTMEMLLVASHGAGRGRRTARRPRVRGDQRRPAEPAVDPGVGSGVGDVGCQRHHRARDGRPVRPVGYVALGFRRRWRFATVAMAVLVPGALPAATNRAGARGAHGTGVVVAAAGRGGVGRQRGGRAAHGRR